MPLTGIKILDLSRLLPGPFCTMLLGDLGAEVIKVEDPRMGDPSRLVPPFLKSESAAFLSLNRNKKSLALDLKSDAGREIVARLARRSDVLVEQFRPGVTGRLGIGYDDLAVVNPRLIYCSLTGYGQTGPYRTRPGHDLNYLAYAGILGCTGPRDGPPVPPAVQVADCTGGLLAAIGILAALRARSRTGKGQHVDAAMLDGAVSLLNLHAGSHFAGEAQRRGAMKLSGGMPSYGVYETKDGRHVALGALEPKFWLRFCELTGRDDLAPLQLAEGGDAQRLQRELEALFRERTCAEWIRLLETEDVCLAPVNSLEEVFQDPQIEARGMVTTMEHADLGSIRQLGIPLRFSETPGSFRLPPPRLGEHTDEVLRNLGYSPERLRDLRKRGTIR
jgi:crotonobetainyl-CoA:carnitine CoA-transferase CaiB-like acyl-CoA transferase